MKWLVATAVVAALAGTAPADPLDELGFGAAAAGMANARSALGIGAEAAHGNPAGLALAAGPELLVGWQYAYDRLVLDGDAAGVLDAHGTSFGLAIPFQLGRRRIAAGVAVYLPDQFLARVQLTPVSEPHYTRFESRAHRLVLEPAVAISSGRLAFGAGVSILAGARSNEIEFDVEVAGGDPQGEGRLDVAVPVRVAPLVGVRWQAARWLDVAAAYRGELSLEVALDVHTTLDVPNVVTGDASVALRAVSYFTPAKITLGVALHPRDDLTLTADLAWERWSTLGSGVPDLRVLLALDVEPPLVTSMQPPARFHNIVSPCAGLEWRTGSLRLRTGAGYLPSPVPAQTGLTSFADGARIVATAGLGLRVPAARVLTQPIDLDVALAWQHVVPELVKKDLALQPGGAYSSGGEIFQASVSATVRF